MPDQLDTIFTHLEIIETGHKSLKMTSRLTCVPSGTMNPMTRRARPRSRRNGQETTQKQMTKYSIRARKMVRGAVLDSPLKGKTTEICVAEGAMSACPACFKDRLSHWSFVHLPDVTE